MCGLSCHVRPSASCTSVEHTWFIVESQGPWTFCFLLLLVTAWLTVNTSRVHALWQVRESYHTLRVLLLRSPQFTRVFFFFLLSFISSLLCPVFPALRRVRKFYEKRLLASSSLSVRLSVSVRMEQLGSQWTDFHEILYLNIFRKFVEKIRVLIKS